MSRRPTPATVAWRIADALQAGAEELRTADNPVPVADRLLVMTMAACRELRTAVEQTKRGRRSNG